MTAGNDMKHKYFILGSNGLLGSYCYRYLKGTGSEVFGISKSSGECTDEIMDMAKDLGRLKELIKKHKPDVLINCVKFKGSTDECEQNKEACWQLNAELPLRLAKLQQEMGFAIVHLSTHWVYEGKVGTSYSEEGIPYPVNFYSFSKYMGEIYTTAFAKGYIVLRVEGLFGFEKEPRNIMARVIGNLANGKQVQAANDQFSRPVSALECAKLIEFIVNKGVQNKTFLAGGKEYVSRYQLACKVAEFFKLDKSKIIPVSSTGRSIRIPQHLDVSLARIRGIGYAPKSVEDMLLELARLNKL
ncbi:hypothetical protein COT30_04330 [Candidatus Micrarchaeota archaeon CG08_land_8_20_14_0_20_49_17]|nr:MAG: hypothetical protein COT30_04330 [Candidatus Micrarchaeota archaeon CG08_land_8_20_14_0_20_49_17]